MCMHYLESVRIVTSGMGNLLGECTAAQKKVRKNDVQYIIIIASMYD